MRLECSSESRKNAGPFEPCCTVRPGHHSIGGPHDPLALRAVPLKVRHGLGDAGPRELERELQAECAVGRLAPEGMRIGICANLVLPYGPPLRAALPDTPDAGFSLTRWAAPNRIRQSSASSALAWDCSLRDPFRWRYSVCRCSGTSHNQDARHADLGIREAMALSRSPAALSAVATG